MTSRDKYLKRTYGISESSFQEILQKQGGRCPICLRFFGKDNIRPCVDHNHRTGELRGIVCLYCNHRVIGRHSNPDLMQRVADYLRQGLGLYVPDRRKRKKRKRVRRKRK